MKFGGTSVANFEAITRAIFIVGGRLDQKPVVVVSALSKVTDLLYRISDAAASRNVAETKQLMGELRSRHVTLASDLLEQSPALKESAVNRVNTICDSLEELVNAVCAVGELSDRNKAIIISNGELLSSTIICFTMNAKGIRTNFIDARKMMITSNEYLKGEPVVDEIVSRVPDAFELWCWRRLLRVPWTARRSNQPILKEINPGISLEGMMLKLKLQYFGHLM